ncbi:hypothetical protein [Streptomyces sp. NPDC053720]|uniref:hypothetical protein n=1 Tax=Streptomyces sp. NPDC053720 TaxID=3154855 RepID=UPI003422E5F5
MDADTWAVTINRCLEFTCPRWCSMSKSPEDHFGAEGSDVTRVLHMGPMAGPTLPHHDLMGRSVGFDMNLYAYSLPSGGPGRPFVRFADGDDTEADYFDTHNAETLRKFQDRLIATLAGLVKFTHEVQAWDQAASPTERAADEAARHDRPCQGSSGQGEQCALCDPAGASPGQRLQLKLMNSLVAF